MIRVTQGHEKSISLEIFFKSYFCLTQSKKKKIVLYCNEQTLDKQLKIFKLSHLKSSIQFKHCYQHKTQTLSCLKEAMSDMKSNDILLTLPSSKDQFEGSLGQTEFFRTHFNKLILPMSFISKDLNFSLLSDHIPLKDVSHYIEKSDLLSKIIYCIDGFLALRDINNVFISGINPHAGESGLMGKEEHYIEKILDDLENKYPHQNFNINIPADTLMYKNPSKHDLVIFSYHDQGLGLFKYISGFNGVNITFGLPYLRVSPDHGTAFELYGKNQANFQSLLTIFDLFA